VSTTSDEVVVVGVSSTTDVVETDVVETDDSFTEHPTTTTENTNDRALTRFLRLALIPESHARTHR